LTIWPDHRVKSSTVDYIARASEKHEEHEEHEEHEGFHAKQAPQSGPGVSSTRWKESAKGDSPVLSRINSSAGMDRACGEAVAAQRRGPPGGR
jgi:hypothetical protein